MSKTPVFEAYWKFAAERQAIFMKRMHGEPAPWTTDPILQQYKFTNVYRANDRVSQYLIRNVIYDGQEDLRSPNNTFFRIMLFKILNRNQTWDYLSKRLTLEWEMGGARLLALIDDTLTQSLNDGQQIMSGAYIMPSAGAKNGVRKHTAWLKILETMMNGGLPTQILQFCSSMKGAFNLMRVYPFVGNFLAYQYVTDLGYSPFTRWGEDEFTVAGPGSIRGISKCFTPEYVKDRGPEYIIRHMQMNQNQYFAEFGLKFERLGGDGIGGRPLQLIDCQNCFCEIDKYARVAFPKLNTGKMPTRIKTNFRESKSGPLPYFYPPKWGIRL